MDADLVLAAGIEPGLHEGKGALCAHDALFHPPPCQGPRAVGSNLVPDGNRGSFVGAEGCVDGALVLSGVTVDEGEVALGDHTEVPKAPEFKGCGGVFGEGHDAAGLSVEPMDHLGLEAGAQVESDASDEAGCGVALGWVADEAGGLVDDEEVVVLVEDLDPARLAGHLGSHFFQLAP